MSEAAGTAACVADYPNPKLRWLDGTEMAAAT